MHKKTKTILLLGGIPVILGILFATAVGTFALFQYTRGRTYVTTPPTIVRAQRDRPDFSYTQPYTMATEGNLKIGAKLGSSEISRDDGKTYLLVTFQAEDLELPENTERIPLNLSIVIDRSGSMSGNKLEYVKKALISIAEMLHEDDSISVVIYDSSVETIYSSSSFDIKTFVSKIEMIQSGGSTNIEGGLREGFRNIDEYKNEKGLSKVILLSDGLANVGISDADGLSAIVKNLAGSDIVVSTIGVGADYDEKLMASVAISGNGSYYFLEDPIDAERIFAQELYNTMSTIATDISVKFNINDNFSLVRGIGYNLENDDKFNPNNIYMGRTVTYLFEIEPTTNIRRLSGEVTIANLEVRYKDVESEKNRTVTIPVKAEIVNNNVDPLADDEVYYEYVLGHMGSELWGVFDELDKEKNSDARSRIKSLIKLVEEANKRLNNAFSEDLASLEEKDQYLKDLQDRPVNESSDGKRFQKSNQQESYETLYNK